MTSTSRVWLDEALQIIRQQVEGEIDETTFNAVVQESVVCAQRLRDPADVRILFDDRHASRPSIRARGAMLSTLARPELRRLAVFGRGPMTRVLVRFISAVSGHNKIRAFPDEAAALAWLTDRG